MTIQTEIARLPFMRGIYRESVPDTLFVPSPLVLVRPHAEAPSAAIQAEILRLIHLRLLIELLAETGVPPLWQTMVDGLYLHTTRVNDARLIHQYVQEYDLPLHMVHWHDAPRQDGRPYRLNPGAYWAAESLSEYLLVAYGWGKMSDLIRACPSHESWETLGPAIYGVPAHALETGWHQYVAEHYPLMTQR